MTKKNIIHSTKILALFLSKLTFILSPCYIMGASQSSYEDENTDNVESEEKNEEWSITVLLYIFSLILG